MKTILKDAESKMQKALDRLDYEYSTIRAGRANPAVLEKVSVDYYGAMTPINQMAAVSVAEARILVIQPWDVSTLDRKSTRLNSSHPPESRMPSSA